ncbi:conserved phage C-terminal domain-containing protein [Serratia sp. L9]|uniref:conserved phage C-terminal domain-containing protein n=1 Tax=Serratia sp. L9 TaxID=3423946 RepID=UPI003D66DD91
MSRIFDVVQAMSGQKNCIVIPGPYLDYFAGDQQAFALAAVLNQLVFWTGKSSQDDGWFYKTHEELAGELRGVSEDQVQRVVAKLRKKYLPGVIEVSTRKVNGTPTNHYRIDGDKLIALIFPPVLDSAESRNGKRESAESNPQKRVMENAEVREQSREAAESYLYTDQYTDQHKQIIEPTGQPAVQTDPEVEITDQAKQVLKHLNMVTGSKYQPATGTLENIRARLREGHTTDDLCLVADYKQAHWGSSAEMAEYLRPSTLYQPSKFEGYLLSATKWDKSGRPQAVNGKWLRPGETPDQDNTERDAAYMRFIGSALPLKKPSQIETEARKAADAANVRSMNQLYSSDAWNRIWTACTQRLSGGKAA